MFSPNPEVEVSRKIRLANLYLVHAIAYVNGKLVLTFNKEKVEPNEWLMRSIEDEAGVTEQECVKFRQDVVDQLVVRRMDLLLLKLGEALELMAEVEYETVNTWFETYVVSLPLETDDIPF